MLQPDGKALERITFRKAAVLALLADLRSQPYVARQLGISVSGVGSAVESLKVITECESVADLGRGGSLTVRSGSRTRRKRRESPKNDQITP